MDILKILALGLGLFASGFAWGQQTALDSAYGTDGLATSPDPLHYISYNSPTYCSQQADGKILTVATYSYTSSFTSRNGIRIQRWLTDGRLDSTFNSTGTYQYRLQTKCVAQGIRALANGKILAVAGPTTTSSTNDSLVCVRLLQNGTPDTSYGNSGVAAQYIQYVFLQDAVVLPDGGVALVGYAGANFGVDLAVYRLDSSGAFQSSFGSAGKATYDFGPPSFATVGLRIAEATGGKLWVSVERPWMGQDSVGVARILANGALDLSFGGRGYVLKYIPHEWVRVEDVIEGQNGTVTFVAALQTSINAPVHRAIFRLTTSGLMDMSFGIGGVRELTSIPLQPSYGSPGPEFSELYTNTTLRFQPDGKLLIGLTTMDTVHYEFDPCIVRLLSSGANDTSFGLNGWARSHMAAGSYNGDILLQPDGKIVQTRINNQVGLVRYKANASLAVESTSLACGIRVYPNPTTGENVRIEGAPANAAMLLTDAAGRTIDAPYNRGILTVAHLPAGLYFLRITTPAGSAAFRLVKSE